MHTLYTVSIIILHQSETRLHRNVDMRSAAKFIGESYKSNKNQANSVNSAIGT